MKLLKIVGLLVVIFGACVVIFWQKGSYGIQPNQKGKTCSGYVASGDAAQYNFPTGTISITLFERTFIYSADKSTPNSYCMGFIED